MKPFLIAAFALVFSIRSSAQDNLGERIAAVTTEGKAMYRSEMASWYGTDIFMEKYSNRENIGGYLSYTEGSVSKCIFFSKTENPQVIGTISFDSTYDTRRATTDLAVRDFTPTEKDLYTIRKKTLDIVNSGDSLFKFYKGTNYNLVPLISGGERKVYILTGPQDNGVVIFGNDYLLKFDEQNQLLLKRRLHKSLISIKYDEKLKEGETEFGAMHTHLPETGDLMTPTDICTLMLYARFAKWKQHMVVSEKYMNTWNCDSQTLTVVPR